MAHAPFETGILPLVREFGVPAQQKGLLSPYEDWQHKATSSIIDEILRLKYGCSDRFSFKAPARSESEMVIKLSFPKGYDNSDQAPKDRLGIEKFIGDIRSLKMDIDDIYFLRISEDDKCHKKNPVDADTIMMSFHIPDILPYLSALLDDVPESTGILQAIHQVASSYMRAQYKHLPQYNN